MMHSKTRGVVAALAALALAASTARAQPQGSWPGTLTADGQPAAADVQPLAPPLGPLEEPLWDVPFAGPPAAGHVDLAFDPNHPNAHPQHLEPGHQPGTSACGCPSCAAGGGGPHFYQPEQLPFYAPSEMEFAESSWLPDVDEDWYGRPLTAGVFGGAFLGDELIESQLGLKPGMFTGVRFGQDYDRRWAIETRLAYATPEVINLQGPELRREADLFLAESSLMYWRVYGRRLRPYASAGLGMAYLDTTDHLGQELREILPTIPVGLGIQYRLDEWLVLHVDVHDNIMLGEPANLALMHNITLAGGVEFRFGGSPNTYYPWNPARNMW